MASGVMIYGGFVYLPKTVMNAAYMCSSTYIWIESGDFKDCLYMPYSDRSTITIPPMRSSMATANEYKLINTNVLDMCGILIFPNGDIAHLVFSKKNNKVMIQITLPVIIISLQIIIVTRSAPTPRTQ